MRLLVFAFALIFSLHNAEGRDGRRYSKIPTIIGGERVDDLEKYDFYGQLQYSGRFACGGTVVDERYFLTAEHCVLKYRIGDLKIFNNGKYYDLEAYWVSDEFDVALLHIKGKFDVEPIELSDDEEQPEVGRVLEVAGMGQMEGGQLPGHLRRVSIPVISKEECRAQFPGVEIKKEEVCMYEEGRTACFGDSGGPLWDPVERKQYGIVSWGGRDCDRASVYAKVAYSLDVIKAIINEPKPEPQPEPEQCPFR